MGAFMKTLFILVLVFMLVEPKAQCYIPKKARHLIEVANSKGPYIGIVIPNLFELNPLLESPSFKASSLTIHCAGRRFRFGTIVGKKVILVMTGLGMVNAAITTQLLLTLFKVKGVVHYGIAGNANPSFHVGDVTILSDSTNPTTIPQYWAHLGLWNWQRYGQGPEDELALEEAGDYSRKYGHINFASYTTNISCLNNNSPNNLLNNVWYQAEEVFPIDGTPEKRQHAFWFPVDAHYFNISKQLELVACVNATTCISPPPRVPLVARGASASIFVDNAAYRDSIFELFNIGPVEMESAGVALICHQQRVPFIVITTLSDLAGGGSAESNESDTFLPLAAINVVLAVVEFIKLLSS